MSNDTPIWMGAAHSGPLSSLNARNRAAYEAGATPGELLLMNQKMVWHMAARHWQRVGSPVNMLDDYKQGAAEAFLYYFRNDPKRWDPDKGTLGTAVGYTIIGHLQKHVDAKQRHAIALPQGLVGHLTNARMEAADAAGETIIPKFISLDAPVSGQTTSDTENVDMIPDPRPDGQTERVLNDMTNKQDLARVLAHMDTIPHKYQLAFKRWLECDMIVDHAWRKHYRGKDTGVSRQSVRNYIGLVLVELQMEFPELVEGLPRIQPGRKVLEQWLARREAERYGAMTSQLERATT